MSTSKKMRFHVENNDRKFVENLKSVQSIVDCVNNTIIEKKFFNSIWNTLYAVEINNRLGKSIYQTDLTETYNQHNADVLTSGSISLDVPVHQGFASHFREEIEWFFFGQSYSISNFLIDLEFYKFISTF